MNIIANMKFIMLADNNIMKLAKQKVVMKNTW